jgi:uncharacterized protein YcfJ
MRTITDNPLTGSHGRYRLTSAASALVMLLTVAHPASAADYYVMAPVLSADPIVSQFEVERPTQHCSEQAQTRHPHYYSDRDERHQRHEQRFVPGLIGGLVGGLIGNQFGGGSGKKILTVIGALAGSSIANDIARERRHQKTYAEPVRRSCYTTYERETVEQIDGYHVVYEYAGQEFSKQLNEHPGEQIRVRVQLSPTDQT